MKFCPIPRTGGVDLVVAPRYRKQNRDAPFHTPWRGDMGHLRVYPSCKTLALLAYRLAVFTEEAFEPSFREFSRRSSLSTHPLDTLTVVAGISLSLI